MLLGIILLRCLLSKYKTILQFAVGDVQHQRIDDVLLNYAESFKSMTAIKRQIRCGLVYINDKKATLGENAFVQSGDIVRVVERTTQGLLYEKDSSLSIPVLYEDDYCAIVQKPFDSAMFAQNLNEKGFSLHTALLHSLSPIQGSVASPLHRPQPVHRLDTLTGGLVLVAKTRPALVSLTELFTTRNITKKYLALVPGTLEGEGDIHLPLGGKEAHSAFKAVNHVASRSFDTITTVEVALFTGRTHQIRRHLDSIGHPVIGDPRYWFTQRPTPIPPPQVVFL